jgi:uncharacterized integral membrane protein
MDENETHEIDDFLEPEPRPKEPSDRDAIPWGAILLLIWAVALIVFSVQNADDTTVKFLAWESQMPVALLVMVTALATMVVSALVSAIYRRRRRKRRQEAKVGQSDD